eukprot:12923361-Alexandrium_andersonii.AAC.1
MEDGAATPVATPRATDTAESASPASPARVWRMRGEGRWGPQDVSMDALVWPRSARTPSRRARTTSMRRTTSAPRRRGTSSGCRRFRRLRASRSSSGSTPRPDEGSTPWTACGWALGP